MYLTHDHTGPSSGIQYGKKGDKVKVIKVESGIALVDGEKGLFHIREEKLSEHPPDAILESKPEEKQLSRPSKTTKAKVKPGNLFS